MNGKKRENQWHNKSSYLSNVLKMYIGTMIDEYEVRKIKDWVNIFLVIYSFMWMPVNFKFKKNVKSIFDIVSEPLKAIPWC